MSSMINLKASRKTPSITISANPVTNVHVTNRGVSEPTMGSSGQGSSSPSYVHYPDPNQVGGEFVSVNPQATASFTLDPSAFQSDDPEKSKLMRENAVLKLIIDIQHNNPIIVNKYIIADDVSCGCTTKNTYRKVHAIFVVVNGETKNLKYDFSDVMYTLKELHISTKFVW